MPLVHLGAAIALVTLYSSTPHLPACNLEAPLHTMDAAPTATPPLAALACYIASPVRKPRLGSTLISAASLTDTSDSTTANPLSVTISVTAQSFLRAATAITPRQIEQTAGAFDDPSRFLQILPGVISDNDQRNDMLVRGGNPSENLFVVDGIDVPSINHLALSDTTGGLVSMIDNDAIGSLHLFSGPRDARFTDRLSSVVDIATVKPSAGIHSTLDFGIAGTGGSNSRPLAHDGGLFVSARQSVLHYFTDDIGMNGVPVYRNALARASRDIGDGDKLWGLSLGGIDSIAIHPSPTDSEETNPFDILYHGWRDTAGGGWQHTLSRRAFAVFTASDSEQAQDISETAQLDGDQTAYTEHTHDGITTGKIDYTSQPRPWLLLNTGASASLNRIDYAVSQPISLANPYSATGDDATGMDDTSTGIDRSFLTATQSAYAEAQFSLPLGTLASIGARTTHWALGGKTATTPKLSLTHALGRRSSVVLAFATFAQMPPNLYLLAFTQNQALKPITARQFSADFALIETRFLKLSSSLYRKRYSAYPVAQDISQLSLANISDTFGQAFLLFPMLSAGKGLNYGAEISAEVTPTARLSVRGSLTFARTFYSGLDGVLRRGNFDIPCVANITALQRLGKGFTLSARYNATSGRPYTPDNLAASVAQNRDVYDLTQRNGLSSAAYSRLDLHVEQTHTFGKGELTWHIGLDNAFNHKNFYSYQWLIRSIATVPQEQTQMGIFPDGGLKFRF